MTRKKNYDLNHLPDADKLDHSSLLQHTPHISMVLEDRVCDSLVPGSYNGEPTGAGTENLNKRRANSCNATADEHKLSRDGGYGWVVVGAAFLCSFVVDGIGNSFGMYLIEFTAVFGEPESVTSWIGSLLFGVYLCMGPVACGLADSYGYRLVITSGSVIAAIGFFSSCFVTNVYVLFLTFGVIGGIGFGLIYSPSIMCVCSYFKETSALAVGISVCGSSVGGMVFPILVQLLLEYYGWQGSMLFLAGISLQCCIAGGLMRDGKTQTDTCSAKTPKTLLECESESHCLPPALHQAIMDTIGLTVYRNPVFLVYSVASFIGSIAFLTPSFFLPDFAIHGFGVSEDASATIVTAVSGAGIFGRIFWGWLADHPHFDALAIHNLCIFTSGITLVLVPFCATFSGLLVDGVVYGFFIAPYISLMSTILTSRIGLESLPNAFGQTQFLAGLASMVGPPIHSAMKLCFASYDIPFYFAGAAWMVASGVASTIFLLPKKPIKCQSGIDREEI